MCIVRHKAMRPFCPRYRRDVACNVSTNHLSRRKRLFDCYINAIVGATGGRPRSLYESCRPLVDSACERSSVETHSRSSCKLLAGRCVSPMDRWSEEELQRQSAGHSLFLCVIPSERSDSCKGFRGERRGISIPTGNARPCPESRVFVAARLRMTGLLSMSS
jgi:hypothetical protein